MTLVLDTNMYTAYMGGAAEVRAKVRAAQRVLLPAATVAELLYGFRHGSRYDKNRAQLDEFLDSPFVEFHPATFETADRFGRIAAELRRAGTPIPVNDVWIAAHAMESGAVVLTGDGHFERISGLAVIRVEPSGTQ